MISDRQMPRFPWERFDDAQRLLFEQGYKRALDIHPPDPKADPNYDNSQFETSYLGHITPKQADHVSVARTIAELFRLKETVSSEEQK